MSVVDAACCAKLAIRKGHLHSSVFADAREREVIFATQSKDETFRDRFAADLREYEGTSAKILWGSIITNKSYQAGTRKNLPRAKLAFDKFHVIKLACDAADRVWRMEMRLVPDAAGVMKKQRYVWPKNPLNPIEKLAQSIEYTTKLILQAAKAYQIGLTRQKSYCFSDWICSGRHLEKWSLLITPATLLNKLPVLMN